jgi:hypothetical protein
MSLVKSKDDVLGSCKIPTKEIAAHLGVLCQQFLEASGHFMGAAADSLTAGEQAKIWLP